VVTVPGVAVAPRASDTRSGRPLRAPAVVRSTRRFGVPVGRRAGRSAGTTPRAAPADTRAGAQRVAWRRPGFGTFDAVSAVQVREEERRDGVPPALVRGAGRLRARRWAREPHRRSGAGAGRARVRDPPVVRRRSGAARARDGGEPPPPSLVPVD